MHAVNYRNRFNIEPSGPATILRLVSAAAGPYGAGEIEELAHVDLMVDDAGCHFGTPFAETFGMRDGAARTDEPACTPGHVARVVWSPYRPDALVAYDLATAKLAFPPAVSGSLPWIGALRVTRHAWPELSRSTLHDILSHRGMGAESDAIQDANPDRPASQEVLRMAHLVRDMLTSIDVRCTVPWHPDPVDRLRPVLGEFAGDFALQGLINLTTIPAVPVSCPPDPWDCGNWMSLPMDDLVCYARADPEHWGASARDEIRRRLGGSRRPAVPAEAPRVILRRVAEHRRAIGAAA